MVSEMQCNASRYTGKERHRRFMINVECREPKTEKKKCFGLFRLPNPIICFGAFFCCQKPTKTGNLKKHRFSRPVFMSVHPTPITPTWQTSVWKPRKTHRYFRRETKNQQSHFPSRFTTLTPTHAHRILRNLDYLADFC